jgi:hypothetical protein
MLFYLNWGSLNFTDLGFIRLFNPIIQTTCSTACREDPLGLPSAAWALNRMVLYRRFIQLDRNSWIGPIRPTEDPAGLPYKLSSRKRIVQVIEQETDCMIVEVADE